MLLHIVIADDHGTIRLGMKYIIQEWMPGSAVYFAKDMPALLNLLSSQPMDIVVLDINIPGGNNFHMINMIKGVQANVKILMLSAYDELIYGLRYIDSGADGYVQKDSEEDVIKEALNAVYQGKKYLSSELKEHLLQNRLNNGVPLIQNPIESLTNRELEVCRLLIGGKSVGEIAKTLYIHTSTVGTYKNKIYEKLSVRNVKELMDMFNIYGLGEK